MKILKQEKNGNQIVLEIEESYSKLEPHMKKAFNEASKELKLPGFRAGKVPADVLKKYITDDVVMDRALQLLVNEIYPSVIEEAKFRPVDYPFVDIKKIEKDKTIVIEVKVDVYPQVKLGTYKGITLKKADTTVTDTEIQHTLDYIKQGYAKQNNIEADKVVLDDEFAKKISAFATFEELKNMLKANIETEKKGEAEHNRRDQVTKKLADIVHADIPNGMIEREIDAMVSDLEVSLQRNRMTLASYMAAAKKDMAQIRKELSEPALTRIKATLALEEISTKEKLAISEDEIDQEIKVVAEQSGKSLEDFKKELSFDVRDTIKTYMMKEKAAKFVVSNAKEE